MGESAVARSVQDENEQLKRYLAVLVFGWVIMLVVASLALVLFGDVLMHAFV